MFMPYQLFVINFKLSFKESDRWSNAPLARHSGTFTKFNFIVFLSVIYQTVPSLSELSHGGIGV